MDKLQVFKEKAGIKHNHKYIYDKVAWVNSTTKVCIICPIHGEFWQTPKDHLHGNGCPKCSGRYMDREYFIEKSIKIHGNKYIYDKVVFNGVDKKVCLVCPEHGDFWATPTNHMRGTGCPKCANKRKTKTQEEFNEEFIEKYGNKYDTSELIYKNVRTKVKVICPEHGEFWQYPKALLDGHACPVCSGHKDNTNTFLIKFNRVWGENYDTSKIQYVDSFTKVCVVCHEKDDNGLEHGEFWATPSNLLHGYGCPKCGNVYQRSNDEFIEYANFVHNGEYDYSKTKFEKVNKKVEIICHKKDKNGVEHGSFWQTPNGHLNGRGCPKCGDLKKGREKKTFDEYITESRGVHGDKYEYLEFEQYSKPAKMYCHEKDENGVEHGEFWQLPANHLRGKGCPKCRSSHLEEKVRLFLEKNNIKYRKEWKQEWLKKHNFMPLDFYLPEYGIGIECQGKHHFEPVNFGGKMSIEEQKRNLEIQQKNDKFKKEQCEEHGVKLLYINYFDKNIEEKLDNELMNNSML